MKTFKCIKCKFEKTDVFSPIKVFDRIGILYDNLIKKIARTRALIGEKKNDKKCAGGVVPQ